MLSQQACTNPAGNHRRQNSTPTLSIWNKPNLRPHTPQHYGIHRRGISLDEISPNDFKQDNGHVGVGKVEFDIRQQDEQQQLQEAQQTTARPGQQQNDKQCGTILQHVEALPDQESDNVYFSNDDINSLMPGLDPTTTSQDDTHMNNTMDFFHSFDSYTSAENHTGFASRIENPSEHMPQNKFTEMKSMPDGLPDTFANADTHTPQRPCTPANQTNKSQYLHVLSRIVHADPSIDYHPLTPSTTPFSHRTHVQHASFSRTAAGSPTRRDVNLTIKASHPMQRGKSCQDNFATMRQPATSPDPMSPPRTAPLQRRSVDIADMPQSSFLNLNDLKLDMPSSNGGYNPANYSPMTNAISSTMSSFQSSPEATHLSLFDSAEVDSAVINAKLSYFQASQGVVSICGQPPTNQQSPETRAQSVSEIDVEECIEDTGVTVEEIASFIQGPFPDDSKWRCLFEEERGKPCGKRFARKENAKSHVQTHLGDRQYVCKVCHTRFVRQHDLKRHFKIHTTDKPHKCPCGKDFHRHDALTRHRQRGMCVGAFEDSPKKSIKRGRPKKQRPNTEDRIEKAAKTRLYVMERTRPGSTYASSISGSSEYSHGSPPSFDDVSVTASSPSLSHKAFQDFFSINQTFEAMTPPASPGLGTANFYSSPLSPQSFVPKAASRSPSPKITSIPEESHELFVSLPESSKDSEGLFNSPPELDLSSSSPATSNFFDFVGSSDGTTTSLSDHKIDCLNPQFLNSDFPLFDGSSKEGSSPTNFDDFLSLGDLTSSSDVPSPQKQDQSHFSGESVLEHELFNSNVLDDGDDIFSGL